LAAAPQHWFSTPALLFVLIFIDCSTAALHDRSTPTLVGRLQHELVLALKLLNQFHGGGVKG
jgi:hypothetical protein